MAKKQIIFDATGKFKGANELEDVLCLATLVASGKLQPFAEQLDATNWFESIGSDCDFCPLKNQCLACIINK